MTPSRQFALGTAQLGLNYGIANQQGKPDESTGIDILRTAARHGATWFDTAQAYGDSETLIGKFRQNYPAEASRIQIATKLGSDCADAPEKLHQMIEHSLEHLACKQLDTLLLHDETTLDQAGLWQSLETEIQAKRITRIGVSVYTPSFAYKALTNSRVSVIQVPLNLFDQRLIPGDFFARAQQSGKTVFVRSIYLQGLLLMQPELASKVPGAKDALWQLDTFCRRNTLERDLFCHAWTLYHAPNSIPIMGADNVDQVQRNAELLNLASTIDPELISQWDHSFHLPHPDLIHPPAWS